MVASNGPFVALQANSKFHSQYRDVRVVTVCTEYRGTVIYHTLPSRPNLLSYSRLGPQASLLTAMSHRIRVGERGMLLYLYGLSYTVLRCTTSSYSTRSTIQYTVKVLRS